VDIVIVRENTEDLYAGIEFARGDSETRKLLDSRPHMPRERKINKDSAVSLKVISESSKSANRRSLLLSMPGRMAERK
jgi:isocitrate dehydrogenase (NAD+)